MLTKPKALLLLHIAVFLFGFTAILGNVIDLSALMIVWWRVLITVGTLIFFVKISKLKQRLTLRQIGIFLGIGGIIALHWLSFYGCIKISNSSITLVCLATTSLFTAIIEPVVFKKPLDKGELFLGIAIIPCMALIVNGVDKSHYLGILVGLASAFFASLFGVLNKKYIEEADTQTITFIEMVGVWLFLSIVIPFVARYTDSFVFWPPKPLDWMYIVILATLCTTVGWMMALYALKVVTAFEANLVVNIEPIYGIALAAILLKEYQQMNFSFYLGACIMVIIVLSYPIWKNKLSKSNL